MMLKARAPSRFTRTQFVKAAAYAAAGSAGAYLLYEFAPWLDGNTPAASSRKPLQTGTAGRPLMRELVRYATLAASGHNAQPWQFRLEGNTIQIEPDPSRRLPAVDPNDRELWISLGCAVENLSVAARKAGFEPEITYPDPADYIRVDLSPRKPEENPLFASIPKRQNTRSEYDGRKLDGAEIEHLISIPLEPGISLHVFNGHADTEKVLEYVTFGNEHQLSDCAFIDELCHWVRFDKREAIASMDGLYSLYMGRPQSPRWIGERILRHTAPRQQSDSDAKVLRSSVCAVAVASSVDDRASWVRTGQVYQRLALKLTSNEVKSAFMNQPNEVPAVREQFRRALRFGDSHPQLLLRLGYADSMPSSFRRSVDDVIV